MSSLNGKIKLELYHDNFQNYKKYNIPKAQLVITDIPYNLGANAYVSSKRTEFAIPKSVFGESAFLTREEAERKLKERESNE